MNKNTLIIKKMVALHLLVGLSFVWGHVWWMTKASDHQHRQEPAERDGSRCPPLIKSPPMFYSDLAACPMPPRLSLWLAWALPTWQGDRGTGGGGWWDRRAKPGQAPGDGDTHTLIDSAYPFYPLTRTLLHCHLLWQAPLTPLYHVFCSHCLHYLGCSVLRFS